MVLQPVYHKDEEYMPSNIEALAEFLDEIDLKMAAANVVEEVPENACTPSENACTLEKMSEGV
jgi:hypothetical protein